MKKDNSLFLLVTYGVVLYVALTNLKTVLAFAAKVGEIFLPIIVGLVIAFILSVPMSGFEKIVRRVLSNIKLPSKKKKNADSAKDGACAVNEKTVSAISLFLTLLCIALVITLVITTMIPQLVSSVKSVYTLVEDKWPEWIDYLGKLEIDTSAVTDWMKTINFDSVVKKVMNGAGSLVTTLVGIASSSFSAISTGTFAAVIALYVLMDKKSISHTAKRVLYAVVKKEYADNVCGVASVVKTTYSKFLSGQCVEAVILGCMMFASFSIFRLPYAGLTAILTAFFAFIPYIGAAASGVIATLLTLISAPDRVIWCVAVYLVTQFIENQFVYPHVVGSSVGLSALWTLAAVLIGGNLFGVMGVIFFIPLVAVIFTLVGGDIDRKLEKKNIVIKDEGETDGEKR